MLFVRREHWPALGVAGVERVGSALVDHRPGGGADAPEEGTATGLSVCMDAWDNGGSDWVGFTVKHCLKVTPCSAKA